MSLILKKDDTQLAINHSHLCDPEVSGLTYSFYFNFSSQK